MPNNVLIHLFPFSGIDEKELLSIQDELSFEIMSYEKNDIILSKDNYLCEIGFILSGECAVYKKRRKDDIPLQTMKKYDSFGILTLFSKEEYPTFIVAKKKTRVLFIKKESFLACLKIHSAVSMNVMVFLADRIQFLNKKIATLSGASVEEKVLQYISIRTKESGEQFSFNFSQVATSLNIGRASLYRALDKLQADGIIEINEKSILIKRKDALKG